MRRARPTLAFTLLELVTTLVLMALVAGLAITGFGAVTRRATGIEAMADLDVVTAAEHRFAYAYGGFTPFPADLTGLGSGLTVQAGSTPAAFATKGSVSLAVGTDGTLALAAMSQAGECHVRRRPPYGTKGTSVDATLAETEFCDARAALPSGVAPAPVVSARW